MAVAQEIKTTPAESYSPPPIVISNQALSYFLSHNLPLEYMRNIMHGCHLTNTADRFQITDETASSLSFAIQEIPDQEAFAEFMLRVRTANYPEHTTTTKTTASYSHFREEDITIIAPSLPDETLHRALRTHIVIDTKRFLRQLPRATTVTYFLRYPEEIPTE